MQAQDILAQRRRVGAARLQARPPGKRTNRRPVGRLRVETAQQGAGQCEEIAHARPQKPSGKRWSPPGPSGSGSTDRTAGSGKGP